MKQTIKRHLISFAITFLATFCLMLYPAIEWGNWDNSIVLAAIISASRSAFKIAWELFLVPLFNYLIQRAKDYSLKNYDNNS